MATGAGTGVLRLHGGASIKEKNALLSAHVRSTQLLFVARPRQNGFSRLKVADLDGALAACATGPPAHSLTEDIFVSVYRLRHVANEQSKAAVSISRLAQIPIRHL